MIALLAQWKDFNVAVVGAAALAGLVIVAALGVSWVTLVEVLR